MPGETNLSVILKSLNPKLNSGTYVFGTWANEDSLPKNAISFFKEPEGITVILKKEDADALGMQYTYEAAWITLQIHSALDALGLTAAFATALAKENISANVVAANFHDHIFVHINDAARAIATLQNLSKNS